MVFPLTVGRERSRAAAFEAARLQRPLGVLLQSKPDVEQPGPDDLHWVGTTANVLRYITAPDGAHHAICQGVQRFRVLEFLEGYPFMAARVQLIGESEPRIRTSRDARSASRRARRKSSSCSRRCPRRSRRHCRASRARRGLPTSSPA